MVYTVGEMAKLLGVPASTLRYYDKEGLLPFVERSPGGMRMFQEKDYEWLQIIECLKKTGMPLKDIRTYIDMAMRGDETIEQRLKMIEKQRQAVRAQMAELQKTLPAFIAGCVAGAAQSIPSGHDKPYDVLMTPSPQNTFPDLDDIPAPDFSKGPIDMGFVGG